MENTGKGRDWGAELRFIMIAFSVGALFGFSSSYLGAALASDGFINFSWLIMFAGMTYAAMGNFVIRNHSQYMRLLFCIFGYLGWALSLVNIELNNGSHWVHVISHAGYLYTVPCTFVIAFYMRHNRNVAAGCNQFKEFLGIMPRGIDELKKGGWLLTTGVVLALVIGTATILTTTVYYRGEKLLFHVNSGIILLGLGQVIMSMRRQKQAFDGLDFVKHYDMILDYARAYVTVMLVLGMIVACDVHGTTSLNGATSIALILVWIGFCRWDSNKKKNTMNPPV